MAVKSYIINGGTPLYGSVRVGGAKNASYKLMIAALLGSKESRLLNLPDISDVELVGKIINELGATAANVGERTYKINPQNFRFSKINAEYGESSRASTLFIPPLLFQFV